MKLPSTLFLALFSSLFFIAISTYILPGSTLYASNLSQAWTSPNNNFSLRFITDGSAYFASITYNGIPVWKAGGGDNSGGAGDPSSSLQFLPDGNLRLVNGTSGTLVWHSNTAGRGVSTASLHDSGNFVLQNGTVPVWSTFDNPTDTILPSQNFTTREVLRSGLYSFSLSSGKLTLRWNSSILYWNLDSSSSLNTNLTSPSLRLESIGALWLFFDVSLPNGVILANSSDYAEGSDVLRFLRLDSDGNLRIYSSARGSETSTVRWAAVSDQCQVYGYCGNMGICSYKDLRPICRCPSTEFFAPVDSKDSRRGCRRKVEIKDCQRNLTMLQLDHAKFLTYPPELPPQLFYEGISASRLNCLYSSSCIASTALSDGTGSIYMKISNFDFASGYQSPALPSTSFVKVCRSIKPNTLVGAWRLHPWIVAAIVIGTILSSLVLEGGLWLWFCGGRLEFRGYSGQYDHLRYASGAPLQFSYKELKGATKGFNDKLGAGGSGAFYRGVLANRSVVAVKELEAIKQGEKQFRMELATISSTHHLNLIRLIGFCSERSHRLLVYEFMKNGSLDDFLFTRGQSRKSLNWEFRFRIALGTARGITYLHEECRDCIVHCNIKPENILLDENYNAEVSEFGLAKLINPNEHRYGTLTSFRGTREYFAPEWLAHLPMTSKSDVYSYGMVLLEIVSGRRSFEVSAETNQKKFSVWAYEEFEKGNAKGIVDKRLADHEVDMEQVIRAIQVSFWCIQEQPSRRPTMGNVVQMLEGITKIEKPSAPKVEAEGFGGETSVNVTANVSALSSFAASIPAPFPSSSFEDEEISYYVSGRNVEREISSLLHCENK
ncbi:G-type lectin S-receptor-like serine/threonine-protein kinase At1g34300 isoform X1 [Actinidia eriantha]|uniref:G-type lectin S-receptor-like serine/threonine-protein kinase At1g34300 isoform X1 n=1 Tax=Actinidia eriantha TaxID=165200 RepID=UPI00258AD706|nr:G-type lectin S-receptor-like serine/threonine-protein kinase At1g34300 isoform X1 [Actinidia eriantha]